MPVRPISRDFWAHFAQRIIKALRWCDINIKVPIFRRLIDWFLYSLFRLAIKIIKAWHNWSLWRPSATGGFFSHWVSNEDRVSVTWSQHSVTKLAHCGGNCYLQRIAVWPVHYPCVVVLRFLLVKSPLMNHRWWICGAHLLLFVMFAWLKYNVSEVSMDMGNGDGCKSKTNNIAWTLCIIL